jgi:hypothetical protein
VGRHAILAALERNDVSKITVITEYPELLNESNWECSCPGGHTNPSKEYPDRVEVVTIPTSWNEEDHSPTLVRYFHGASAVISCLGHRQPGWSHRALLQRGLVSTSGNRQIIAALQRTGGLHRRAVVVSSVGIQEDWPPMEFSLAGKIMGWLFKGPCKGSFVDLNGMEVAYKSYNDQSASTSSSSSEGIDYLFVRPVGIGEEQIPKNQWFLQQEKGKDKLGMSIAKMDVARFMVNEAMTPTLHRTAVVIGGEPPKTRKQKKTSK